MENERPKVGLKDIFLRTMRRIERKDIQHERDLELERLAHAPVLGKDAAFAVVWYSFFRFLTLHVITPSGAWVIWASWNYWTTLDTLLDKDKVDTQVSDIIFWWDGAHACLAWLWFAARDQAKNILSALAKRIGGGTDLPIKPATPQGGNAP
jgi:hypothetical protein